MRELQVDERDLGAYEPLVTLTGEEGYEQLVTEPTILTLRGRTVAIFDNELDGASQLLKTMRSVHYHRSPRAEGLESNSRTFGYLPRVTIRRDYCTASAMATEQPKEAAVLDVWAHRASAIWRNWDNEGFHKQRELLNAKVRSEWIMPGGVFTSGICNYNNPLRLHYDKGNFPGSWSAMFAFTHSIRGGNLVLPGYRVAFRFHKPSFIIFDGQANLHGVTPIKYLGKSGFRYSVVYYAMQGMCRCLSSGEELARIRVVKTERERKRAGGS